MTSTAVIKRKRRRPTGTAPLAAPVNTSAPSISGSAVVGSVLTVSEGAWTGNPNPTFAYQWKRDGSNIVGQTASTYTTSAPDVGASVTCTVTATNSQGSANATSNGITVTNTLTAPVNTVAPVVSGAITVGSLLSCTTGTWTGNPTPTYAYQWNNGADIGGATSSTYTLQVADEEATVYCRVTATNSQGSVSANSNFAGPIEPASTGAKLDFSVNTNSQYLTILYP